MKKSCTWPGLDEPASTIVPANCLNSIQCVHIQRGGANKSRIFAYPPKILNE